ncbi:MAG TPA: hypothetical protein VJ725_06195 [Thermoanaerobaculia bacterium]|nr:hypothetical protein [Thermoanaerobaculia bacterium]
MSAKIRTTAFALLLAALFATTANALPRGSRLSLPVSDSSFFTVLWDWMTSLFAVGPQEKEGSSMDPNGQSGTKAGSQMDPNGQPTPGAGSHMDPDGDPTTEAGGDMDPNGVK